MLAHKLVCYFAKRSRLKLFSVTLNIIPVYYGCNSWNISRRSADACFLKRLYEGRFCVSCRWLSEMLIFLKVTHLYWVTGFYWRKHVFLFALIVFSLFIKNSKSVELYRIACCLEVTTVCRDINRNSVHKAVWHLRSYKSRPNEFIKLVLVTRHSACLYHIRCYLWVCWSDGFVSVLSVALSFIFFRCVRDILIAIFFSDKIICRCSCFIRNSKAVGTHIGDKTCLTHIVYLNTLIKLLSGFHRSSRLKAETSWRFLL